MLAFSAILALVAAVSAQTTFTVANSGLQFTVDGTVVNGDVSVNVGDTLVFSLADGPHTATPGATCGNPDSMSPLYGADFSASFVSYKYTIAAADAGTSLPIYCATGNHCQQGMIANFVVAATGGNTGASSAASQATTDAPAPTSSAAPPTDTSMSAAPQASSAAAASAAATMSQSKAAISSSMPKAAASSTAAAPAKSSGVAVSVTTGSPATPSNQASACQQCLSGISSLTTIPDKATICKVLDCITKAKDCGTDAAISGFKSGLGTSTVCSGAGSVAPSSLVALLLAVIAFFAL